MSKLVYILIKALGVEGIASVLASLWIVAGRSGIATAVIIVGMILVHELGHALFCHIQGIESYRMRILPIGGFVSYSPEGVTPWKQAWITFGGPLFGGVVGVIAYYIYTRNEAPFLLLFAFSCFAMNLLNLVPIYPLDGGKIAEHLHKSILFLGIPCYLWLFATVHNPIIILIGILFAIKLFTPSPKRLVCQECETDNDPIQVKCKKCQFPLRLKREERLLLGMSYAVLLVALTIGTVVTLDDVTTRQHAKSQRLRHIIIPKGNQHSNYRL